MKTYKKPFSRVIKFDTRSFCQLGTGSEEREVDNLSKETGPTSSMWESMDED